MPRLDVRSLDREIAENRFWPVVWIYGTEAMKVRETIARLRHALVPTAMNTEMFDGAEHGCEDIVHAAQTLGWGSGVRWVGVRNAHLLSAKDVLSLQVLLSNPLKKEDLSSVCVFQSRDLDMRTKWAKILLEQAAVVPCEEIAESDRPAWVAFLIKRMGMDSKTRAQEQALLTQLDPWSLDRVQSELEKWQVHPDAEIAGLGLTEQGDELLRALMERDRARALQSITSWSEAHARSEGGPMFLGLLAWHIRKGNLPVSVGEDLVRLDLDLKSTFHSPEAAWREFVLKVTRNPSRLK